MKGVTCCIVEEKMIDAQLHLRLRFKFETGEVFELDAIAKNEGYELGGDPYAVGFLNGRLAADAGLLLKETVDEGRWCE